MTCIRSFTIWDRLELHADVCQRGGMSYQICANAQSNWRAARRPFRGGKRNYRVGPAACTGGFT